MKKYGPYIIQPVITVIILIASLFIYGKLEGPITFSSSQDAVNKRTFTVEGVGTVNVKPDKYYTDFTIEQNGTTQSDAKEKGNSIQNKANNALKKAGFSENDIKTTNYSINPAYDYNSSPGRQPEITGYTINITTEVSAKSSDKISKAIDILTPLGVNVNGIQSTVSNTNSSQDQARTEAISQAKSKASSMAKAAGFKLGSIASIKEGSDETPNVIRPLLMQGKIAAPAESDTQINPGTQEVSAHITITYYID